MLNFLSVTLFSLWFSNSVFLNETADRCHSANYTASQPGRHCTIFIVTSMRILYLALRNFTLFVGFVHPYGQLAVSHWPDLAGAQVLSQGSPYEVCGGKKWNRDRFFANTVFRYQLSFQSSMFIYNLGEWTVGPLETAEKRDLRASKLKDKICCCTLVRPRASHFLAVWRCGLGIGFVFLVTCRDLQGCW